MSQSTRKVKSEQGYDTSRLLTSTNTTTQAPAQPSTSAPVQRLGSFKPIVPAETASLSKKFAVNTSAARKKMYAPLFFFVFVNHHHE